MVFGILGLEILGVIVLFVLLILGVKAFRDMARAQLELAKHVGEIAQKLEGSGVQPEASR